MVSVIIPNYNHAPYLQQRIESVLNQTFRDFELIILDDCSGDNSREMIERYRNHPKVSAIVYNEQNSGSVFKQWKKGIEMASGDYVWIAESDDYASADLLETLHARMQENPALGIVYCDSNIVSASGECEARTFGSWRNEWLKMDKWSRDYTNSGKTEIRENLLQMCTINNASAVLFRKEALVKANPFELNLRYTGDWFVYLKTCLNWDIAYVNKPMNFYREHQANSFKKSRNNSTFIREYFLIFDWVLRHIEGYPRKDILKMFFNHTRHALLKGFDEQRRKIYKELAARNPALFARMIVHNVVFPIKERVYGRQ